MINIKNFFCKTEIDIINQLQTEINNKDSYIKGKDVFINNLQNENTLLKNKVDSYEKQIDYSFIPKEWQEVLGDVTTNKYEEQGTIVPLDVRDLLTSTCVSRKVANELIKSIDLTKSLDEQFMQICLLVNNKLAPLIKYKTNTQQFNKMDLWLDGDLVFILKEGDCDLSARFYIRVINDCLSALKMYEYQKYVWLGIGYIPQGGHAWGMIYNPIKKKFMLLEATEEFTRTELQELPNYYDVWFAHNTKKVYFKNAQWRAFL